MTDMGKWRLGGCYAPGIHGLANNRINFGFHLFGTICRSIFMRRADRTGHLPDFRSLRIPETLIPESANPAISLLTVKGRSLDTAKGVKATAMHPLTGRTNTEAEFRIKDKIPREKLFF